MKAVQSALSILLVFFLFPDNFLAHPPPPVVIVPGIGGSQIQASLDRSRTLHWWCYRKYGWYTLWLNIEEFLSPLPLECWTDDIKLVYNKTTDRMENTPGVLTRIPDFGNTSSIEYLDPELSHPGQYFAPFVKSLVKQFGYQRGFNIRGAPYDFRYGPEYADEYYTKLKSLIESTFEINRKKKILLVSQSMGCPYTLIFLKRQSQEWIDKYIASWITISGPWGGAVKSLRAYISGDPFGIPKLLDNPILMRAAQRTYTSLAFIRPIDSFWKPNEVLVQTYIRNYTVKDYDALFKDIGFALGSEIVRKSLPAWSETPPKVPIYCLHGVGIKTPGVLYYGPGDFPDDQPYVRHSDGDGTVNIRSLKGCERWQARGKYKVDHIEYPGAEHNGILGNHQMINDVFNIIKNLSD